MAEASRPLERSDAIALARFLDEPREAFGTRVTIAERDKQTGRVTGTRDAHVGHCSLSLHPKEPELADERLVEICEQVIEEKCIAVRADLGQSQPLTGPAIPRYSRPWSHGRGCSARSLAPRAKTTKATH